MGILFFLQYAILLLFWASSECISSFMVSLPTCSVRGLKPSFLHRVVGEKAQEDSVATGDDWRWLLGATKAPQGWSTNISPIEDLQVVISALQMSFHVNLIKNL